MIGLYVLLRDVRYVCGKANRSVERAARLGSLFEATSTVKFGSGSNMLRGMNIDTEFNAVDDQSDDRVMDRFEF